MVDIGVDVERDEETDVDQVKEIVTDEWDDDGVVVYADNLLDKMKII